MGKEKRCCRRTVSSFRGVDDVGRDVAAVGRDAADCGLEPFADSSVCAVKWEVLRLGVTCGFSSWKSSRMWRNEGGRDAGLMRNAGWESSPCSPSSSMDRLERRAFADTASSTPASSRFELPLSIAMSSEGGRTSARAGVDCQEGKLDIVKVGVEDALLGESEGVSTGNTVS